MISSSQISKRRPDTQVLSQAYSNSKTGLQWSSSSFFIVWLNILLFDYMPICTQVHTTLSQTPKFNNPLIYHSLLLNPISSAFPPIMSNGLRASINLSKD
jgi:hypothetical protein